MYDLPAPTAKTRLRVARADRSSSMTDAQTVAAEREATRLLAEAGYDRDGRPFSTEPDSVAPDEWMTDPLMSDYVTLYGSVEAAAEQYRANRWALLHADETRAYSMTERGGMSRYVDLDWHVDANLSSASFAYAPEQRMTDRRAWERARAPYGACLDSYGECVYGATRIAPLAGGHAVTHTYADGTVTTYTPIDERVRDRRQVDGQTQRRQAARKPRKASRKDADKVQTAAERMRAYRARQRQKTAPITVQEARSILPRIDWQADA